MAALSAAWDDGAFTPDVINEMLTAKPAPTFLAVDALDAEIAREKASKTFKSDQIRVSSIGSCGRRAVAQALGMMSSDIPWKYSEGGHLLEGAVERRLLAQYPLSEAQVSVPTSARGTWTHPDLLMVFAMSSGVVTEYTRKSADVLLHGHGVQIKSTAVEKIAEYNAGQRDERFGLPKQTNVDQVLLEWFFWRQAGFCLTKFDPTGAPRRRIEGFPETYELLYVGQEDFIGTRASIPVEWDAARAARLAAEFAARVEALKWGELPARCKDEADYECGYVPKTYHFNGPRAHAPQVCALYEQCWGRKYEPKAYDKRAMQNGRK